MEQAQRNLDAEQMQQQQLKLRDRQKFFEEVFQHEVDFFFPMSHLQIEHRRRKYCGYQHGAGGVSGMMALTLGSLGHLQAKSRWGHCTETGPHRLHVGVLWITHTT